MKKTTKTTRYKIPVSYYMEAGQAETLRKVADLTKIPMSVMIGDFASWLGSLDRPENFRQLLDEASRIAIVRRGEANPAMDRVNAGFAITSTQKEKIDSVADTTGIARGALIGGFADWLRSLKEPRDYMGYLFQALKLETIKNLAYANH